MNLSPEADRAVNAALSEVRAKTAAIPDGGDTTAILAALSAARWAILHALMTVKDEEAAARNTAIRTFA